MVCYLPVWNRTSGEIADRAQYPCSEKAKPNKFLKHNAHDVFTILIPIFATQLFGCCLYQNQNSFCRIWRAVKLRAGISNSKFARYWFQIHCVRRSIKMRDNKTHVSSKGWSCKCLVFLILGTLLWRFASVPGTYGIIIQPEKPQLLRLLFSLLKDGLGGSNKRLSYAVWPVTSVSLCIWKKFFVCGTILVRFPSCQVHNGFFWTEVLCTNLHCYLLQTTCRHLAISIKESEINLTRHIQK